MATPRFTYMGGIIGVSAVIFFLVCSLSFKWKGPENSSVETNPIVKPMHHFNVSQTWIISMDPSDQHTLTLQRDLALYLFLPRVQIFHAINGTHALQTETYQDLSLYTKYLMLSGRHDHMQLSSPGMLGCLLSHVHLWSKIKADEIVAIFEEDAYVDMVSAERMHVLYQDVARRGEKWDVLLLESGHNLIASGRWVNIGELTATCSYHQSSEGLCTWFGTRGYLITYDGAQHLLRYVYPISVQVDSLMGLVASFSPGFKMLWTRKDVAHLRLLHVTGVWDACFKCYLPASPYPYVFLIASVLTYVCNQCIKSLGNKSLR